MLAVVAVRNRLQVTDLSTSSSPVELRHQQLNHIGAGGITDIFSMVFQDVGGIIAITPHPTDLRTVLCGTKRGEILSVTEGEEPKALVAAHCAGEVWAASCHPIEMTAGEASVRHDDLNGIRRR